MDLDPEGFSAAIALKGALCVIVFVVGETHNSISVCLIVSAMGANGFSV
jgi:hypothetical protein